VYFTGEYEHWLATFSAEDVAESLCRFLNRNDDLEKLLEVIATVSRFRDLAADERRRKAVELVQKAEPATSA
jgi:hypothetical protein